MDNESCGNCHYYGWIKLTRWCFRPENNKEIKTWGKWCRYWFDMFAKVRPKIKRVDHAEKYELHADKRTDQK